jgi:hypothetical protein
VRLVLRVRQRRRHHRHWHQEQQLALQRALLQSQRHRRLQELPQHRDDRHGHHARRVRHHPLGYRH